MSAWVCHPVCVRALVRGVRALVRVVNTPPLASICKHLRPVFVSSVCQECVKCVSSVYLTPPGSRLR
jgi:predicted RNA-binding protein with PUA domain